MAGIATATRAVVMRSLRIIVPLCGRYNSNAPEQGLFRSDLSFGLLLLGRHVRLDAQTSARPASVSDGRRNCVHRGSDTGASRHQGPRHGSIASHACQSRLARHCLALRSCTAVIPLARAIAVAVARPTWLT